MTAQELKNSILQLAIQGKLVHQDPQDEPAALLLKRIEEEKAARVKAGIIAIDKKHTADPIVEDDIPYDLPSSWSWARFADIAFFSAGKTPERHNTEYWTKGTIPWVSISDMVGDGVVEETKEGITEKAYQDCFSGVSSPQGTLLMSFKLTIGKMSILGMDAVHNEAIISIFPFLNGHEEDILKSYLFKVMPIVAVSGNTKSAIKGKTLNATSISNLMVPIPPLTEQRRIVTKIEELMPLVEEYGKAEERLTALNNEFPDMLRRSILQQAIRGKLTERDPADEPASELLKRIRAERQTLQRNRIAKKSQATETIEEDEFTFDLPENWAWVKLGWLCQKVGAGSTPKGGATVYVSAGIKFLREQNVHDDGLHLDGIVFIDKKTNDQKMGSVVQPQDILMNITGGSIGRNALVPDDFDIANVNQHVLIIRLVDKRLRHYLHYCLCAPFVLNQMFSKQIGDKPGLSATKVENFVIPLPPLAEQYRIVDRVNELLAVCDELK